jgi:hypothetical protein
LAAACLAVAEDPSVKTLRQLLTGEDVIQLVIRLGLLALLIFWTS